MGASPIVQEVYREHIEHFGEPDESIVYEDLNASPDRPSRIDIFVWNAAADVDITTFSTIGMSAAPMHGCNHRAEMHLSIRGTHDRRISGNVTKFLANLAIHPFLNGVSFDW
jgi:hypothetical protein